MVRVFRNDAQGNLSYLATQAIKYVPVGDRIELNLGEDPEVVFELVHLKSYRDQIWLLYSKPGVYKRLEDGLIDVDHRATVAGWDSHAVYAQRIRNYTERPIRVEVRRSFPGHAVFRSSLGATLHDYNTVQYSTELAAGQKAELLYEVVSKEGRNRKQNNVTLEAVPVPRPDYGS